MGTEKQIHVALAFDETYITPFYVLLTSIFFNNKNCDLKFHIIASGINEVEIKKIRAFITKNKSDVEFYRVNSLLVSNFVMPEDSHFSPSTYFRLFFPSLVNNTIKKLLYIDTDIVVIGDLLELYNTVVTLPVAASLDPKENERPELGIHEKGKYFNAGVLLINLEEWNNQKILEKAINYLHDFPEKIKFVDQDALNAVLLENWNRLPEKFNVTFYDIPEYLPKRKIKNFLSDKIIIHFSTQNKPWHLTCTNRLRFLYHDYLKKSPYKNAVGNEATAKNTYWYWAKRNLKELLIDHTNFFEKKGR